MHVTPPKYRREMLEKPRHLHKAAVWPLRKRNRARAKKSRPTPNTHTQERQSGTQPASRGHF